MRQLGTLAPQAAERFANALQARGVANSLRPEADGTVGIWIHNEDQLDSARSELDAFEQNPGSARFDPPSAPPVPTNEPDAAGRQPPQRGIWQNWRRLPVTGTLVAVSVIASLASWSGGDFGGKLEGALLIAPAFVQGEKASWIPGLGLSAIASGQVWRLVTPIFLHGGPIHLLFNMSALWLLGGAVETVRGRWRMAFLVLASAIASNLAEYYYDFGFDFSTEGVDLSKMGYHPNPMFLGMSGVVFALFGFVWIRSRLVPRSGFLMPRDMVVWMLIWLLVCTSGLIGPIANVAHGVGLLVGMICGAAPRLWMKRPAA
jgi:GlpG protein